MSHVLLARFIFLFAFLFSSCYLQGKSFIKLNIHDCAKCSILLSELNEQKLVDSIFICLPEILKVEEDELKENLGLTEFEKFHYVYSDSLYDLFDSGKTTKGSEFIILHKGRTSFRAPLESQFRDKILIGLRFDKYHKICPNNVVKKRQIDLLYFGKYVINYDNYSNLIIHNLKTGKHFELKPNNEKVLSFIYKNLYKSAYNKRYPIIKKYIHKRPKFKPDNMLGAVMLNDEKLLLSFKPWDFVGKVNGDTSLSMSELITVFDLKTNSFIEAYSQNESNSEINLMKILNLNNKLYGLFTGKSGTFVSKINLNNENKTYSTNLASALKPYPNNYFDRVGDLYSIAMRNSKYSVLFYKSDSLYSSVHKKLIRIPYHGLPNNVPLIQNGLNYYDSNTGEFIVQYTLDGQKSNILYYVSFDALGNRTNFKAMKNEKLGPTVFINSHQYLQYNNETKCFEVKDIW